MGIINRTRELTSRIESERIKVILKELEEEFNTEKIIKDADFLIHSIELGGLDMDYALWVVSHYLKEVLPPSCCSSFPSGFFYLIYPNI